MCENLSYDAIKRAGDFFFNSVDSSKSKSEEGLFCHSLVQMKEGHSPSEFFVAGKKKRVSFVSFPLFCFPDPCGTLLLCCL